MGVAVLNPRDCLQNPLSSRQGLLSPPPRMRSSRNPNPNRPNKAQPSPRKRSPNSSPPPRAVVPLPPVAAAKDLVMGQVKILKRGEKIPEKTSPEIEDLDLGSTHRLGPDPKLVPTQIRLADGFYAGSAFVSSPPPSSLPLPAFFMRKSSVPRRLQQGTVTEGAPMDTGGRMVQQAPYGYYVVLCNSKRPMDTM